jgi:thymidylate synthase (FAD)
MNELEAAAVEAAATRTAELEEAARPFRRNAKAERMINQRFSCLNHGFVELVDYMGSDVDIERAARVSYTGGENEERPPEKTNGLIRYLMRKRHTTPFEMCELKFRIAAPMFVWRQWIRHRTANVNEFSGRYSELPDLFYVPEPEQIQKQSTANHQGRGDAFSPDEQKQFQAYFQLDQRRMRASYDHFIGSDMAKELARINLPVAQYTLAVWKMDLHNLLHFLALRLDPHAQYEIRVYAEAIADITAQCFPLTWQAFEDYVRNAVTFSAAECMAIRALICDEAIDLDAVGLSSREQEELRDKLRRKLKLDAALVEVAPVAT